MPIIKNTVRAVVFIAVALLFSQQVTNAAFNNRLSYQGRLTDTNGVPVADAAYSVRFDICTDSACATSVWNETLTVNTVDGLFSAILGTAAINLDFNSADYWMKLTVGGVAYTPNQRISPVAMAINSYRLGGLISGNASGNIPISNGTVNTNLNADLLDGYHGTADPSAAPGANVYLRSNASGYTYTGWINTVSGVNDGTAITRIYASSDAFIRYYTPAGFEAQMKQYIDDDFVLKAGDTMTGQLNVAMDTTADLVTNNAPTGTSDIHLQPNTSGGRSSIIFESRVNATSDSGYITFYDDLDTYAASLYPTWGNSSENGALVIGATNDAVGAVSDIVVLKSPAAVVVDSPNIFMTGEIQANKVCRIATHNNNISATWQVTDTCPAGYCAMQMIDSVTALGYFPEGSSTGRGSYPQYSGVSRLLCCRCQL
jgi:hypothetical protein